MQISHRLSNKVILTAGALIVAMVAMVVALGVLAFTATGDAQAQTSGGDTTINDNRIVDKDEVVEGDLNVTNGNLVVFGEVRGNAVVVNGNADIEGRVTGDLAVNVAGDVQIGENGVVDGSVLAFGTIVLGPHSRVGGNVTAVGGKVIEDPKASVVGEITAPDLSLKGVTNQVVVTPAPLSKPQSFVDDFAASTDQTPGPHRVFSNAILSLFIQGLLAALLLGIGAVIVLVVPGRVKLASSTLEAEPGPSIVVGFIAGLLLFPLASLVTIILTVSVIGLPFIPVLIVGLVVAMVFGLVTIGASLGRWVLLSTRHGADLTTSSYLAQVMSGTAIILGTTIVPSIVRPGFVSVIMAVVLYFATCAGLGAAILSRFGTLAPPKHAAVYFHNPLGSPTSTTAQASHFVADPRRTIGPNTPPSPLAPHDVPEHLRK